MNTSALKISWGTKITILYCGFVALIATLVISAMRMDWDLVDKDYYKQEIGFQQQLDAAANTAALSAPLSLTVKEANIVLRFPPESGAAGTEASVHFYAPAAAALDRRFTLPISPDGAVFIPRDKVAKAAYTVKISWTAAGKQYFEELPLNLATAR